MRFYNHFRHGTSITYTQIMARVITPDIICIPTVVPKVMDPYILWRETTNKESITKFTVRDKVLDDWFSIKSNKPIHKILSAGTELHGQMK
jgi:hypothetical protein